MYFSPTTKIPKEAYLFTGSSLSTKVCLTKEVHLSKNRHLLDKSPYLNSTKDTESLGNTIQTSNINLIENTKAEHSIAQVSDSSQGIKGFDDGKKTLSTIKNGAQLKSPGGRKLKVVDIFVPRSNSLKSRSLPARFRNLKRKIVVFGNGSVAPLQEVKNHYKLVA